MWVRPSGRKGGLTSEEGLRLCNLVIGARDVRFAGDPRCRSLRVRHVAFDPSTGPQDNVTLIALAVAQAATGLSSGRQFLGMVGRLLPGYFPRLPDQTQYNCRLRRLTPWITTVQ
jgi:hypothetical protein